MTTVISAGSSHGLMLSSTKFFVMRSARLNARNTPATIVIFSPARKSAALESQQFILRNMIFETSLTFLFG